MRFSTASALLGLPLLVAAEGVDYQAQFQAQFQEYLGQAKDFYNKYSSYIPSPNKHDPVGAAEAKAGEMKLSVLTLDNWNETLFSNVTPETTTPDEWWVLVTGGNKTCFGRCDKLETAFNQSSAKFAVLPGAPHTAIVNCEKQPVLCNSWSAPPGALWMFEILPAPAKINIWVKGLNLTTVTSDDILDLQKKIKAEGYESNAKLHDGTFHPYHGLFAENNIAVLTGYIIWAMNLIPSWAFMIGVSMLSRTFVSSRARGQTGGPARG